MLTNLNLKRIYLTLISILFFVSAVCQIPGRQRNTIYVLDCTGSMNGYNGAPDIWRPTKNFLKAELEKEAKENPKSRVVILPFQQTVLHPIVVNLNNIEWTNIENVLDGYLKNLTATNVCDSWLEAEKYIDQACDNYIVLMTDGHDNIGGSANEPNRVDYLEKILKDFCGKYENTKGFYVELTSAAALPNGIQNAIDICADLYKINAIEGIPTFGCASDDVVSINSRDLPTEIVLGFSNSGTFNTSLTVKDNPYLNFHIKDNQISQGRVIIQVESKFGDDIEALNKAVDAPYADFTLNFHSDDVIITNPQLDVILNTTPLRSIDLTTNESHIERVKPFLWVKGNPADTLRWNLNPEFSEEAIKENSSVIFKLHSDKDLTNEHITFNGEALATDSMVIIRPGRPAIIEVIVGNTNQDTDFNLTLNEISSRNLDRLNGEKFENQLIPLTGNIDIRTSVTEIIVWIAIGLILFYIVAWFTFIRNQKYPKFKKGIIIVQSPYFATIRVKGYRKIVMSDRARTQGFFDKLWRGKILYHKNPVWPSDVEITPSGRNMRFSCQSNKLICTPQPLLMRGSSYEITDTADPSFKIIINVN